MTSRASALQASAQVRGDLIRILGKLFRRKAVLDGIVIETTGLAVRLGALRVLSLGKVGLVMVLALLAA